MSRGSALWARVLAGRPTLATACSSVSAAAPGADSVAHDALAQNDAASDGVDGPAEPNDHFADIDVQFNSDTAEFPVADDPPTPDVKQTFAGVVDLWLTQSRTDLKHALRFLGLPPDVVFPTKRPLLVCGTCRRGLTEWACCRVRVPANGWPSHLDSAEHLSARAAARILASSEVEPGRTADPTCFEGETIAVEVPNRLLAADQWIVIWPVLEALPERMADVGSGSVGMRQWERVRRVIWCVSQDRISPRDLLNWLSRYWVDTPVRVALFRAALLARNEIEPPSPSSVLRNLRRTLYRFDGIEGHPWIVVGS